uniref:Uncharacterized protein n=1 Tax=Spongospora subterranea TaxID=70186 RepID=A0A0H5QND7_9EUKA|eukprot:CRZ03086.1 hypothetical protein [Spongospora subterranea]
MLPALRREILQSREITERSGSISINVAEFGLRSHDHGELSFWVFALCWHADPYLARSHPLATPTLMLNIGNTTIFFIDGTDNQLTRNIYGQSLCLIIMTTLPAKRNNEKSAVKLKSEDALAPYEICSPVLV